MAGSIRAVWSRVAACVVATACAQAEALSDDSLPNDPNASLPGSGGMTSVASGGAPASTSGGAPNIPTGGAPQAATGGAAPSPPGTGGVPSGAGGAAPSTGGTPVASGGTTPANTGGAPPTGTGGSPDFNRCVALTQDNACTRCVCGGPCQAQALACGASSDTARNASCQAIVECGMTEHCSNIQCYCGDGVDVAACETPLGPCVAPIEAAAGSSDLAVVGNALTDTNHAVNLANAVGDCAKQNCAADCGL